MPFKWIWNKLRRKKERSHKEQASALVISEGREGEIDKIPHEERVKNFNPDQYTLLFNHPDPEVMAKLKKQKRPSIGDPAGNIKYVIDKRDPRKKEWKKRTWKKKQ